MPHTLSTKDQHFEELKSNQISNTLIVFGFCFAGNNFAVVHHDLKYINAIFYKRDPSR